MKFAYLIEPPFNFRDADGRVTGCDIELARHVLEAAGISQIDFIETEFAELLPGVAKGKWRITTGLFATDERRQIASFSRSIWGLPDGLLVARGNPRNIAGYRTIAGSAGMRLAVVRDQVQHPSAARLGVSDDRIQVFETYTSAAYAVRAGAVDAFASVARAHTGFLEQNSQLMLDVVTVPHTEKPPAFGSFAFAKADDPFRQSVDAALAAYLGSTEHRAMMRSFGFSDGEVDLVVTD